MSLVVLLAFLAVLPVQPALAAQTDPLTGVWEGRGKGDNPMIPPEGFGFTLVLEARGEDEAVATLTMGESAPHRDDERRRSPARGAMPLASLLGPEGSSRRALLARLPILARTLTH